MHPRSMRPGWWFVLWGLTAVTTTAASASGQPPVGVPIRIGFYAPYFFQPGFRAVSHYEFLHHDVNPRGTSDTRRGNVFVGPQLGVFARLDNHVSLLAGAELGYRLTPGRRSRFHEFSVGASYVGEWQITTLSVDLGSGATTAQRELRNYFLPVVGYTFGQETRRRVGWYIGGTFGWAFSPAVDSSSFYSLEAGVQVRVGKRGVQ